MPKVTTDLTLATSVDEFMEDPAYYVSLWFEHYEELLQIPLNELVDIPLVDGLIGFHPGIETCIPTQEQLHYKIDDWAAQSLVSAAKVNADAFDVLRAVCARNAFVGVDQPEVIRAASYLILLGKFPGKVRRGQRVSENFFQRWVIYETTLFIAEFSEKRIPLTRGDGAEGMSACDIVANVVADFGIVLKFNTVRDWISKSSNKKFRLRCKRLTDFLRDQELVRLGVIKPMKRYAPFDEIGLMTKSE